MTKAEIIEALARERRVETMVESIAHQPLSADLKDLSQMVYMVLLEYDESKLQDLWEHNQMNFFLSRVIVNQYRSVNSPFYYTFRKYQRMVDDSISFLGNTNKLDRGEFDMLETYRVLQDED